MEPLGKYELSAVGTTLTPVPAPEAGLFSRSGAVLAPIEVILEAAIVEAEVVRVEGLPFGILLQSFSPGPRPLTPPLPPVEPPLESEKLFVE